MIENISVSVKKFNEPTGRKIGVASITIGDCFVVHDVSIVQLDDKRILSFPSIRFRKEDGTIEFKDVAHPITSDFRRYLENIVFELFDNGEDTNGERS